MPSHNIFSLVVVLIVGLFMAADIVSASSKSANQNHALSPLESWDQVSSEAQAKMIPIVLLVEQRNCGFCQRAKAERLRPASLSAEYAGRAIFISVATDLDEPPIESNGAKISTFEFAEKYAASLTPTVMFLDYRGNEVQERMVGYSADSAESTDFKVRLSTAVSAASHGK